MIEIVLDGNTDNKFCNKEYPVIEINNQFPDVWNEYKLIADKIIADNSDKYAVIIKINNPKVSLNKLALAIFVTSVKTINRLEYAVFKVSDLMEARTLYKPYIALTIGIKYALTLAEESPKVIYKNISELGYLGIKTKRDYKADIMTLSLPNSFDIPYIINSNTLQDTICGVAVLKSLSLAKIPVNIELNIKLSETAMVIHKDEMLEKIINDISTWIN